MITAGLTVAGWVAGWALLGRGTWLAPAGRTDPRPTVSVVVPARDEAHRIGNLLDALRGSDPRPDEVIVVDDGSTDGTAEVVHAAGFAVVAAGPVPPGWTGKAWACQRGAEAGTGSVLVFYDADVEPAPRATAALAAAAADGTLVSAQPRHRVVRLDERASAGPAVVALLGAGAGGPVHRRWWRAPVAFGPAIAVTRDAYDRSGGHAAVRSAVTEDLALAAAADDAGVAVRALLGGDLVRYRMYPEGIGALAQGWTKNLATGSASIPPARAATVALWVTAALLAGVVGPVQWLTGTGPIGPGLVAYGAFAGQWAVAQRRVGRFGAATVGLFGAALVVFVALYARSAWRRVRHRPSTWKGRPVAPRPTTSDAQRRR